MFPRVRLLYLGLAAFLLAGGLLGCDGLIPWLDDEDQRTLQRCTPVASTEGPVGEWERLGLKGKVEAVAVNPCDPRAIYAGGTKRLFKSSDGGASWDTLYTLSNGEAVNIKVHPYRPDSIYAVHWHGVLRSTDGGRKWQTVFRAQLHRSTSALELGLKDPETLYVGTDGPMGGALYKSTNGGNSWNQLAENGRPSRISSIVLSPANSQIVYVQTSNYGDYGLFVSTNEGKTWTERGDRQAKFALVASPSDARTLYGVERGDMKIVRSQDGGNDWSLAIHSRLEWAISYLSLLSAVTPKLPKTLDSSPDSRRDRDLFAGSNAVFGEIRESFRDDVLQFGFLGASSTQSDR